MNLPDTKKKIHLLIADDDAASRLMLKAILVKEGYRVDAVENGQEAVDLYQQSHPDMILLDVNMPVMDGHEAARQIKQLMGKEFVPILFLTATDSEEALVACIDAGGDDFVTKPYSRILLKARIDSLLRMRGVHSRLLSQHDELEYHRVAMERDNDTACAIFENIVGDSTRDTIGVKVQVNPSSQFSGDVVLSAHSPIGALYLLVGDFTGHGLTAAVGTMPVAEIFHSMVRKGFSMSNILMEINKKLKSMLPTGLFCAASAVVVEPDGKHIMLWNGGLPDVYLYNQNDGGVKQCLLSAHLPLGVLSDDMMDDRMLIVDVDEGDKLYIYSDGLIEAFNIAGEMFGTKRLLSCMNNSGKKSCFVDIEDALNQFLKGAIPDDDVTLVEIDIDVQRDFKPDSAKNIMASKDAAEWNFSMELSANSIRQLDLSPLVLHIISEIQGLHDFRGQLSIILVELLNNAVDYGVLSLNSDMRNTADGFMEYYSLREERLAALNAGFIKINCIHTPMADNAGGRLLVRIEDSGDGFDHKGLMNEDENQNIYHGRGLRLVRSLVESLEYDSSGNALEFVYKWMNA